jgi:hypothetical protein
MHVARRLSDYPGDRGEGEGVVSKGQRQEWEAVRGVRMKLYDR